MNLETVLTLVNAGFTAEMIASFAKPEPKQESKPEPKPEPKSKSKPEPKAEPEPKEELSEIINRLDELTKAIQANNAVSTTAPTPKENDVNDVILNLIKEV